MGFNLAFKGLNKLRLFRTHEGLEILFHSFLTSELDGSELSESCLGRFISTPVPTD